jgi:hypothetical protein
MIHENGINKDTMKQDTMISVVKATLPAASARVKICSQLLCLKMQGHYKSLHIVFEEFQQACPVYCLLELQSYLEASRLEVRLT